MDYADLYVKNWSGDGDIDRLSDEFNIAITDIDLRFGLGGNSYLTELSTVFRFRVEVGQSERLKRDYPEIFFTPANGDLIPGGKSKR